MKQVWQFAKIQPNFDVLISVYNTIQTDASNWIWLGNRYLTFFL